MARLMRLCTVIIVVPANTVLRRPPGSFKVSAVFTTVALGTSAQFAAGEKVIPLLLFEKATARTCPVMLKG